MSIFSKIRMDKINQSLTNLLNSIKSWCNSLFALDSNTVHKTDDETISGLKTFECSNNWNYVTLRNNAYTRNVTTESGWYYNEIIFADNNTQIASMSIDHGRIGIISSAANPSTGASKLVFGCHKFLHTDETKNWNNKLELGYNADNEPYTILSGPLYLDTQEHVTDPSNLLPVVILQAWVDPTKVDGDISASWNGHTTDVILDYLASQNRYNYGVRFGSEHGNTYITSGESRSVLDKLQSYPLTSGSTYEDIALVSNSNILLFNKVNQDTGEVGGRLQFFNKDLLINSYTVDVTKSTIASANNYSTRLFKDANDANLAECCNAVYANRSTGAYFTVWNRLTTSSTGSVVVGLFSEASSSHYEFKPMTDNVVYLGAADKRWKTIYSTSSTINTSDERLKDEISDVPDEVLDAWDKVRLYKFKMKKSIEEKGKDARIHAGVIAQQIQQEFKNKGLTPEQYAFFCYDSWEATEDQYRDDELYMKGSPAGDQYSIRYEEALCIEAAYQRRRADRLEKKVQDLEARLAAIEAKLGI